MRVSYKPTLQKAIAESAFMSKHGQGIEPLFQFERDWLPEIMSFVPCAACHELTARAYLRVVGEKHVYIACSSYER